MTNYYDILGISKDSSHETIKKAYRKLAVKYHPDKNPNDKVAEDKFRKITEAYETLKDPVKRQNYDKPARANFNYSDIFNNTFFKHNPFGFSNTYTSTRTNVHSEPKHYRGKRGQDIRIVLNVTFDEILNGSKKTIKYKRYDKCKSCNGLGASSNDRVQCPKCNGTGKISMTHKFSNVAINQESACTECGGVGKVFKYDCCECSGKGIVLKESVVKVTINKGVSDNNNIIMKYYGHCGQRQGISGNLIIVFQTEKHSKFIRSHDDILCDVNLTYSQAALGCELCIDTLHGTKSITVDSGTTNGKTIIMKKLGLPNFNNPSKMGNHIVKFNVIVPETLTGEQLEAVQKLREVGL